MNIKHIVPTLLLALAPMTFATTNTYVAMRVGGVNTKVEQYNHDTTLAGGIAVGKLFRKESIGVELELFHFRLQSEESSEVVTTTTSTTPSTGTGDVTTYPESPGNGNGNAYGWHRRNPPTTVPGTNTTGGVNTTTANTSIQNNQTIRVTYLMANGVYRINPEGPLVPYGFIGAGVVYSEYDYADSTTIFAYQAGLGLALRLAPALSIALDARYLSNFYNSDFELGGLTVFTSLSYHF